MPFAWPFRGDTSKVVSLEQNIMFGSSVARSFVGSSIYISHALLTADVLFEVETDGLLFTLSKQVYFLVY